MTASYLMSSFALFVTVLLLTRIVRFISCLGLCNPKQLLCLEPKSTRYWTHVCESQFQECIHQDKNSSHTPLVRERDSLSEAVVSLKTVVTFVTWLISKTEFSSSELVL